LARDLYTRLSQLDEPTVRSIAEILEVRGRHPQQVGMRAAYLGALADLSGQHVIEVGCGTGVVGRVDEATSFIWQWCLFAARLATEAGAIDEAQAEAWVEQLRAMNWRAELFGSVTYVSVITRRP
jgi:hypothetical protein